MHLLLIVAALFTNSSSVIIRHSSSSASEEVVVNGRGLRAAAACVDGKCAKAVQPVVEGLFTNFLQQGYA
jgi:hypothetical protein